MSCGKWVPHQENMAQSHRGGQLCNMRPGLTWHKANKHFPESEKMQKGHTPKRKSGVRSAKVHLPDQEEEEEQDDTPQLDQNEKHHDVFVKMFDVQGELAEMIHTDQTGKFPVRSSKYNQCIMVFAKPESGVMLAQTVRDQITGETCETHQKSIHHLHTLMIHPKHQVLDNEASRQCKLTITKNAGSCHLIPPPGMTTAMTQPRRQSKPSKCILMQFYVARIPTFPCTCGVGSSPRLSECSFC